MAKTKAGGKVKQKGARSGKRLGVKIFAGQRADIGQIIIRQRGSKFHPGEGVKRGRDFTLYALEKGIVEFKTQKGKNLVSIKS